jgi:hypothetical protein
MANEDYKELLDEYDRVCLENEHLVQERDRLRELLRDARDEYDRHPDYDWDIDFAREVDRALGEG